MKAGNLTMILAAAGLAFAPMAANAASSLSIARAASPMTSASYLQEEDDDDDGSTAVILGVILVVLIGAAAVSGSGAGSP